MQATVSPSHTVACMARRLLRIPKTKTQNNFKCLWLRLPQLVALQLYRQVSVG